MSKDVPQAGCSELPTSEIVISPENAAELMTLYKRLPYATVAARQAQKVAGEKPSEGAYQRSKELDELVGEIIGRINQLLG